uniref:Retrovirus-related Pol polyprotein from transposon TNT 1-94 n=1 Tax=Tanacetum cinerariifolium TaxID=118510 RepID=A0A6L2MJL0_TANCI|nr:retrovirus-related Pol polyprotein from transposon TNT 1-94 [Tanacetum cinerariifolium]
MGKEVNMAGDSDDALVCCVENTTEDSIMYSGASFHATYCKEELERFKLRSGKVRLAYDMTLDIAGVRDVVLKTYFGTSWTLKDVRWFGEAEKAFFHNAREDKETAEKSAAGVVIKRDCDAKNGLGNTYTRSRIPKEEWQGKDTSLTHLKVFGCDSFVKAKDVYGEAMKCTFISSRLDEMRYNFWDTKSHQVIRSRDITFVDSIYGATSATDSSSLTQVVLVDISENLAENDSIVAEHGLSSEITQSPGGSSDTSEGSENSRSFEDSGRLDEEYSEDEASSKRMVNQSYSEALSNKESVQWKKAINEEMVSLEKNQTCSLVRLPAGKKAS